MVQHLLVALGLFTLASAALFMAREKLGMFWSAAGFYGLTVLFVAEGIPSCPASVVVLYAGCAGVAMALYVSSSDGAFEAFWSPIAAVMVQPERRPTLMVLLVLLPGLAAWTSYKGALPSGTPPPKIRSVHPSPPTSITVQGPGDEASEEFNIVTGQSPVRALEATDRAAWEAALSRGKTVYYENCYYCHGDTMSADGHYADAVTPPPAKFTDPGTIAMLSEPYLYWRVAKGGPGLPGEGTPWDSSMPAWELFIDRTDMWNVIAFLYDYVGYEPRVTGGEAH